MSEALNDRFLRLPEVMQTVGLRRTAIYDKITRGEFPAPIKLGNVSVWLADGELPGDSGLSHGGGNTGQCSSAYVRCAFLSGRCCFQEVNEPLSVTSLGLTATMTPELQAPFHPASAGSGF